MDYFFQSSPYILKGYASISYRLSPHPDFDQDSSTPAYRLRNAKNPDHIDDVLLAIQFLHNNFKISDNYILVGHSCGSTLALQTILNRPPDCTVPRPQAIIGIAGIYDLRGLRDRNNHPSYQNFISGAFGEDESVWDSVSPAKSNLLEHLWPEGKLIILVSSSGDKLVEAEQIEVMEQALSICKNLRVEIWKNLLVCDHDEIWQSDELCKLLIKALKVFFAIPNTC